MAMRFVCFFWGCVDKALKPYAFRGCGDQSKCDGIALCHFTSDM